MSRIVFILFFAFSCLSVFSERQEIYFLDSNGVIIGKEIIETDQNEFLLKKQNPVLKFLSKDRFKNKRIIAALLAFPFPFGIVGLHRIYLGTKPYVPVAYIGSLGGVIGIIPLIDFFVILFDKDFEHYENNGKVLMWVRD